jgi:hypothetical protein
MLDAKPKTLPPVAAAQGGTLPAPAVVAPAAEEKKLVASVSKKPRNGKLEFIIDPWGDIYVDGVKKGVSPPKVTLLVPPGKHTVMLRNKDLPKHVETVVVKPGESITIRHKFK